MLAPINLTRLSQQQRINTLNFFISLYKIKYKTNHKTVNKKLYIYYYI